MQPPVQRLLITANVRTAVASRRGRLAAPLIAAAVLALALVAAASAQAQVSVFPLPGSKYNMPATQVSFRGVAPASVGTVTVTGSKSGVHTGTLEADSDGMGASFVPTTSFRPNETVTVKTGLDIPGASNGTFSFAIAQPGRPPAAMPLPRAPAGRGGLQHFQSRPDLVPPSITVDHKGATGAGDIFVAPQFGPAQDGPMILDPYGNLVWFRPSGLSQRLLFTDFRVQQLYGQPVLTWWQGSTNNGSGRGEGVILNRDYETVATVHAANGLQMDLHEFLVTPQGQAYFIAAAPVWLHGYARPIMDSVVQEVDIKTGLVLFQWDALSHIPLSQSELFGPGQQGHILDPYHANSISVDSDGNLIVSMRNTSTIYEINRETGAIMWQLGGKRSSFKMGPGTTTAFQHDAVVQPDGTLTIFDDGAGPPKVHSYSRGIHVALNLKTMTARLLKQYAHTPSLSADFEGSTQVLPGGDVFLGWGQQPYFTEFNSAGREDFDAHFTAPTSSYRAYRFPWSAQPPSTPALHVAVAAGGVLDTYESWNGATDVSGWRILAGPSTGALAPVRVAPKHKFESTIAVSSAQPVVEAQALGTQGQVLATSGAFTVGAHLSIYGRSAFVAPSALSGVPVSCVSSHACSVTVSVTAGRTLLARSGRQSLAAGAGGVLYFRLSPAGRRMLARARGNRLPVQVTVQDSSGLQARANLNLIAFSTRGPSGARSTQAAPALTAVGTTDFVSSTGAGGVLAACRTTSTCTVRLTVTVGSTVVARTGPERIGAGELSYLAFNLNGAGKSLLSTARGEQPTHIELADGASTASASIALVPFR